MLYYINIYIRPLRKKGFQRSEKLVFLLHKAWR